MKNKVFEINSEGVGQIFPPDMVFKKREFKFLLNMGGDLFNSEIEYISFMNLMKELNEKYVHIHENINPIKSENILPFMENIKTDVDYNSYKHKIEKFDNIFGLITSDFFIYGDNESWGIYLCEYPSITIIGCDDKYVNMFERVFNIEKSSINRIEKFLIKEFGSKHLFENMIYNYKINL
ncbi:hypothetical protein BWI96_10515 [Siphonobacter sp. SORGH_AS_0500]|uniref:hypothetical protein n=1 Tax=Siphonobacter sp. SORGH_AS_0500 TaxID=1864824 RepID=UPI000CC00A7F|nr:hypothetical protein [Siphonobacter sp. SORGH_AS_0500]PKK36795.1 hypothetical protein BWI96_10515 [Siphonobacter sp. SORGH_AS_0500]